MVEAVHDKEDDDEPSLLQDRKQHISKSKSGNLRNCTTLLLEDMDYRRAVGMTPEQKAILFGTSNSGPDSNRNRNLRQRVGGPQCVESTEDLKKILGEAGTTQDYWEFAP